MRRETLALVVAASALVGGLAVYAVGLVVAHPSAVWHRCGLLTAVLAIPGVIAVHQRRLVRAADEALAAAHDRGYWLGVDHGSRGLVRPPTGPTTGEPSADPVGNLRYLPTHHPNHRKAQ